MTSMADVEPGRRGSLTGNCDRSRLRRAIRDSIAAQMMGAPLMLILRQGGLAALMLMALSGRRAELEIGLASLIMQGSMLARVLCAPVVDVTRRKHFLVRWIFASAVCSVLFPVVLVASYGRPWGVWALLGALAAYFVALHIGSAAWFPLLYAFLPSRLRGRYFGRMRRAWQLVSFAVVALSGAVLGREPGLGRFCIVLIPLVVLQFGRVAMYRRLPDPPPAQPATGGPVWSSLLVPLRDPVFRHFLTVVIMATMAQFAAMPFIVPFLRSELGFPASVTLYGTACIGLGSVVSLVAWGRLADRLGTRLVFVLSCIFVCTALVVVALVPCYEAGVGPAIAVAGMGLLLLGVGTSGVGIGYTVRLMRLTPEDHPGPYLNINQAAFGVSAGLIALVAGALLRWLPATLHVAGLDLTTFRVFFVGCAVLMGSMLVHIRQLPRLGEPPLRRLAGAAVARVWNLRGGW